MTKKITKAVFPVAGFGTRFLPIAKAIPKEMLPIVDKPLIQYAVDEAVAAGVTQLIFITSAGKQAIENYFATDHELEAILRDRHQDEFLQQLHSIVPDNVSCVYVEQQEQLGLGHAVLCAKEAVGDEYFSVILA